ncbi:MAG: T9SS type A sorting domain-containing protein [Bacteroidota bacterium]
MKTTRTVPVIYLVLLSALCGIFSAFPAVSAATGSTSRLNTPIITPLSPKSVSNIALVLAETGFCTGSNVRAEFSYDGSLDPEDDFVLQLSDVSGQFTNPIEIARGSSSPLNGSIRPGTYAGNNYKLRVITADAVSNTASVSVSTFVYGLSSNWTFLGATGGKEYYSYTGQSNVLSYNAALQLVTLAGGRLPEPYTDGTNDFLAGFGSDMWLGIERQADDTFTYNSGVPSAYSRWAANQPDNSGGNQTAVKLISGTATWDDVDTDAVTGPGGNVATVLEITTGKIYKARSNSPVSLYGQLQLMTGTIHDAEYAWTGPLGFSSNVQSPVLDGVSPRNNGFYKVTVSKDGCAFLDSVMVTVDCVNGSAIDTAICTGSTYAFGSRVLNAAGTYTDTLTNQFNCDSIVTLTLRLHTPSVNEFSQTICEGRSVIFNGQQFDASGIYTVTKPDRFGCDSVSTLTLTVAPHTTSTINARICAGSVYNFQGRDLADTGTYTAIISNMAGCDSTITLHLYIGRPSNDTMNVSVCEGGTYIFNGMPFDEPGVYTNRLTSTYGCDSLVSIRLAVLNKTAANIEASVCTGTPYSFNDVMLYNAGTYTDTLRNANGCDSIITLALTIRPGTRDSVTRTFCRGSEFVFGSQVYTSPGVYVRTFTNSLGCDSITVLNLLQNPTDTTDFNITLCRGQIYIWHGTPFAVSGTYSDTTRNMYGCDSVARLHLNILPAPGTPVISMPSPDSLMASVTGGYYYWLYNGTFIADTTAVIYAPGNGVYQVIVRSGNCFSDTSESFNYVRVSVNARATKSVFRLYPNPARENVMAEISNAGAFQKVSMRLMSQIGSEIGRNSGTTDAAGNIKNNFSLSGLPTGIYLLEVISPSGRSLHKISKE